MQVFKTYFKVFRKHRVAAIIYAVMFLAISVAITSNIKVENDKFEAKKVNVMVVNEDGQSAVTDGLLDYLGNYATYVKPLKDKDARKDALFFKEAEYILTIPKGFSENFIKDGTVKLEKQTVPDSTEAMSIDNAINSYLNTAKVYLKNTDMDYNKMSAYIKASLEDETQVKFNIETEDAVTYSNHWNSNFFNYLGYIIIAISISGVSMIMISFNGMDIRRRQTASPLTSRNYNLQLILANLVFVLGYLVLFIIAGYLLNKSRMINANAILVWLNAIVFTLTALSISYLVGITVTSRKAVSAIATGISLCLSFISGMFIPQMYLGSSVLKVASFTPAYWYVKANNALMNVTSFRASEIPQVFGYMAIETGFTIAIISIALVVSKRKRQQAF